MRRAPRSSVRIFIKSTSRLTNLLRHCGLGFVLVLGACQKQEPEQSADKKMPLANTELDETKRQFEADVEKSKQNAVSRFPELGVAGSEMNKAFVARVNHLRALNSPEFNYPTWPYQLACQVDYEVQAAKQDVERRAKQAARNSSDSQGLLRKFTVAELLQEKSVPFEEIVLGGTVTKVETGVGNRLSGVIFVDRKVRCDFELPAALYRNEKAERVEFVTREDRILYVTRDRTNARVLNEISVFRVGQHVELQGRLQKKADGSLTFKFNTQLL
jgi:hypothetical protein